jgi:hypothetical protein
MQSNKKDYTMSSIHKKKIIINSMLFRRIIMAINIYKKICATVVLMGMYNVAIAVDVREFGLGFQHNKQDKNKNTFWHQLASECEDFEDWSEVNDKIELFQDNNKNWLPNPFMHNNSGTTAKQQAKKSFKKTGNPVCGLLVMYLKLQEDGFVNKMALKSNREMNFIIQQSGVSHPDYPKAKKTTS